MLQKRLMRPECVGACVCDCVDIVFVSFLEMLRFPAAKKLIFPHFWHSTPHVNWLLLLLWGNKKETHNTAIQWKEPSCARVRASPADQARTLTYSTLADLGDLNLRINILTHTSTHTYTTHIIFHIFFFFSKNDRWMQFWVYWLHAFMELHLWSRLGCKGKTNRPD